MGNILRDEHHLSQINSLSTPGDHFFIKNSDGNVGEVLGAVKKVKITTKCIAYNLFF
jgi:hypothetical protein